MNRRWRSNALRLVRAMAGHWPSWRATLLATLGSAVLFWAIRRWLGSSGSALAIDRQGTMLLLEPRALYGLSAIPWLLLPWLSSLCCLSRWRRLLSLLLRSMVLTSLVVALAHPAKSQWVRHDCTVALLDVSLSMSDEALSTGRAWVERMLTRARPEHSMSVVAFDREPRLLALAPKPPRLAEASRLRSPDDTEGRGQASDYQAALDMALGLCPEQTRKSLVLLGDGLETQGSMLAAAARVRQAGAVLHGVPSRVAPPAEVAVRELKFPESVAVNAIFTVRGLVHSTQPASVSARLFQDGQPNGLGYEQKLLLPAGDFEIPFRSVVRLGGKVRYRLELLPGGPDRFPNNNSATAILEVPGRPRILHVEGEPGRVPMIASALSVQGFDVEARTPEAFPLSSAELEPYDFVILSDVAKARFARKAEDVLERQIRQGGLGLLFAGGSSGYGRGGWANSKIAQILPVALGTSRPRQNPSVALVLVIDRSGSMTGLPLSMSLDACRATVATLSPEDQIEVIAFDAAPTRTVRMQKVRSASLIQTDLSRIQSGGGTEIFPALDMAYQDLLATTARRKHIVLLTDGQSQSRGLREIVKAMIAESISLTVVGLGSGVDTDLLRGLADLGQGRYHAAPTPESLPRIFTREAELVTEQAEAEPAFTQVRVQSPAAFLRGIPIDSAPYLRGYDATTARPPPSQVILVSDNDEPILARRRVGSGWSLAWTSDLGGLWASDWVRWPSYARFLGQLVREHLRRSEKDDWPLTVERSNDQLRIWFDAIDAQDRFVNGLFSTLTVSAEQSRSVPLELPFQQTAPGRYETTLALSEPGSYQLRAEHRQLAEDGARVKVGQSRARFNWPYPTEFAKVEPDRELLRAATLVGKGTFDPDPLVVANQERPRIRQVREAWPMWVVLALGLMFADLLVRRAGFRKPL